MRTIPVILALIFLLGCSNSGSIKQDSSTTTSTAGAAITRFEDTSVVYDRHAVPEVSLEESHTDLPKIISRVDPIYPERALKGRVQGDVIVRMLISPEGKVRKAEIAKTDNDIFNRPSLEAAMAWKFEPPMINGKPAAVWIKVPFRFAVSY